MIVAELKGQMLSNDIDCHCVNTDEDSDVAAVKDSKDSVGMNKAAKIEVVVEAVESNVENIDSDRTASW